MTQEAKPLAGVRVADFSWIIAGPLATKYLGAMGAEVIKIESRKRAEFMNRGPQFDVLNNSKYSCTIDLQAPEGKELVKRLVAKSDIVVENFGYGAMDRLGLGYQDLQHVKPDIIMLSSSGMGRTGPEREYVAYGSLLQAVTGWAALVGSGSEEQPFLGGLWTDPLTALTNAFALLAAIHYRNQTGKGQFIDMSMAEATAILIPEVLMDYDMNRRVGQPTGNRDTVMAPHNAYLCRGDDRWVAIAVRDDADWRHLCEAMGKPELATDPRFADGYLRLKHRTELDKIITDWTSDQDDWEVTRKLQAVGVPSGPSLHAADQVEYAHFKERDFFQKVHYQSFGDRLTMPLAFRLDAAGRGDFGPAPTIGQDNRFVFHEVLGLSEEEIARLEEAKIAY